MVNSKPRPLYPWKRDLLRPIVQETEWVLGPVWIGAKILAPIGTYFLFCILLYSLLYPYLFRCLDYPAFCLLSVLTTHNTNIHAPGGILFSLYFIRSSVCWFSWLLSFVRTVQHTHNTNIYASGRDSNSQPQEAIGRRPSP